MDTVQYNFPTLVHFGAGARHGIPEILRAQSCNRPLLVTDKGLAGLPVFSDFKALLVEAGLKVATFSEILGNPVESQVIAGTKVFREQEADSVLALGGGAAMDVGKSIALMAYHPGELFDYEDGKPDGRPVDQKLPYVITIPTTAGTGSEVGRSSVISEDKSKVKRIIFSARMMPNAAVVDPELTLALPAKITAATGADALSHLTEAYLVDAVHPLCDGIALEGIRLVAENLQASVQFAAAKEGATPEHVEARGAMMNAALMGATAFQKGLGVTHSCAHALSIVCDLHHGLANGILLPYTMAFNESAAPQKFARMSLAAGLTPGEGTFVAWLRELNRAIGIPATLAEVGIKPDHLNALVEHAVKDPCHPFNPRKVSAADFTNLFSEALG